MKNKRLFIILLIILIVGTLLVFFLFKKSIFTKVGLQGIFSQNNKNNGLNYSPDTLPINYDTELLKGIKCVLPEGIPATSITEMLSPLVKEGSTTADDYWLKVSILPVVLGYKNIDGIDYMIGGIKNGDGSCHVMVFVLAGKIDVINNSKEVNTNLIRYDDSNISVAEFKERNPIGKRTRVFFLARTLNPRYLVDELCGIKGDLSETWCTYQRITDLFLSTSYDFMQISTLFKIDPNVDQFYVVSARSTIYDSDDPRGIDDVQK